MSKTEPVAMDCALKGLFDYAGMFPPAGLRLEAAVRAYREYRQSNHAYALGCMVVSAKDLNALKETLQEDIRDLRLSVVATDEDLETIQKHLDEGMPIKMIEMKPADGSQVKSLKNKLPAGIDIYVELPMDLRNLDVADAVAEAGLHAKLRLGGVVAEAFPTTAHMAAMLNELFKRGLAFKATAGLHHAVRSRQPFTYSKDSERGMMHGFMNLLCAAALVWFGGEEDDVTELLEEEGLLAFRVTEHSIRWRDFDWSADELREVRTGFLRSIGTCSFIEPVRDMEALGWL
ncbi:hypothetical protein [Terracidiphilus gabretensis]|uniref:hypothetical protein n=1 Tax=Terracidiphilus gabretensis TaxID=1577687 RepID=UPI000A3FE650|nr:hypothetical protein [Terracidiphilus gabretensis]